ncbi:MAG: Hsp20/alpha crystallin family protein [Lachnospiraceae bacterium]|nr:Hsp20/alpha crystallin family protein [Lachnospiraceae bacterium]
MMLTRKNNYGYDLFDELFKDPFFTPAPTQRDSSMMKTDIRENENNYLLDIELPGFAKENVRAELKDGYLTITAERTEATDENEPKGKYLRRERFIGTCKRSFFVGEDLRQEDIKASFKDGILMLTVPKEAPKKVEEKPVYITIE